MKTENFKSDISGLEALADALDYKETSRYLRMSVSGKIVDLQSVLNFLEDNPGAVDAVFEWAEDNYSSELTSEEEDSCDCEGTQECNACDRE